MADRVKIASERILQFKLGGERTLAEDGYRALLTSALYVRNIGSIEEINTVIRDEFGLKDLPPSIVYDYFNALVKEGTFIRTASGYSLNGKVRDELTRVAETRRHISAHIKDRVLEEMEKRQPLDSAARSDIERMVEDIIVAFFTESSRIFSGYLAEEKKLVPDLPSLKTTIEEKTRSLPGLELQRNARESIESLFLNERDPLIYPFLYEMFQIYVYFEILSIDPLCKVAPKVGVTYLDTNILLDLLLPSRGREMMAKELVRISRELGIRTLYSERTKEELISVIREYKRASSFPLSVLEKLAKDDTGGIIEAYFREKRQNVSLTFEGYCIWLEKAFEKTLHDHGLEADSDNHSEADAYAQMIEPLVSESAREYLRFKSRESIRHDTFHLALGMVSQRKKEGLVWFITDDRSLFPVSKILIGRKEVEIPLSVEADTWLQALAFIKPLGKGVNSIEAFKEFSVGSLSPSLRPISMNKLIAVAHPWLKTESLTPDDLEEIISAKFIDEYVTKAQDQKPMPTEVFEEMIPEYIDRFTKDKVKKLEDEKKRAVEEKEKLEAELRKVTASPISTPILFQLGVVLLVGLIMCVAASALGYNVPDIAFVCLAVVAVVFIGASIFGKGVLESFLSKQRV